MPSDEPLDVARRNLIERQRDALRTGELVPGGIVPDQAPAPHTADEINERYERGEIRIVTEQGRYPLASITALLEDGNYKLDPDYQRRRRWDVQQQSRLIESFIMNVPVPPIFLYEWDYNQYEVMDGLQRLTAVGGFYHNEYALSGLEYWRELEGLRYRDLPSRIRAGIDRRYISSIVLLKETSHANEDPELLKRFVFGRINTGGVHLTPQELRNALYNGPMNDLCKELAQMAILRRLWNIPEDVEALALSPNSVAPAGDTLDFFVEADPALDSREIPEAWRRMTDVELVLRFFATRQRMIFYRNNLRDYLDDYLKAANRFDVGTIRDLGRLYQDTLTFAWDLFGEYAFRRRRGGNWGNIPSTSIYDALTNVLSRLLPYRDALVLRRSEVIDGLDDFYARNSAKFNLRGQTRTDLMDREVLLEDYLRGFVS